jgi:hypothetical protein
MKKAENEKGYLISYGIAVLLTVAFLGIFFMGTDGIAQINNVACQDYECSVTGTQYGEAAFTSNDCVGLCYDDGFEVDIYSPFFYGYLYPVTGSKYLLGTAYDYKFGWTGCYVERNGRSIIVKVSYIEDDDGYVVIHKCTPCDGCCR